jgi:hypothetical protein
LPSSKTTSSGRVTVTLASVAKMAKAPPVEPNPPAPAPVADTPPPVPAAPAPVTDAPVQEFPSLPTSKSDGFILPAKETPASLSQRLPVTSSGRLSSLSARSSEVKLPPKTGALPKLAGRPEGTPPPLQDPPKKKRLLPSFDFKALSRSFLRPQESIFVEPTKTPEKQPDKVEVKAPEKAPEPAAKSGDLQSLEDFSRSREALPPPVAPVALPVVPPPVAASEFAPLPVKEPGPPPPVAEIKPAAPPPVAEVKEFASLPVREPVTPPPVAEITPVAPPVAEVKDFAPLPVTEPVPPPVEAKKPALPPPLPLPKAPVLTPPPVEHPAPAFAVAPPMTDNSVQASGDKHLLPPPVHESHPAEAFPALPKAPALAEPARIVAPPVKVGAPPGLAPAVEPPPVVEAKAPVLPPPLPVVPAAKKDLSNTTRVLQPAFPEEEKAPSPKVIPAPEPPAVPTPPEPVATAPVVTAPVVTAPVVVAPVETPVVAPVEPIPVPLPPIMEPAPPAVTESAPSEIASAKAPEPLLPFAPPSRMRLDPPRKSREPKGPDAPEDTGEKLPAPEKLPEPKGDAPAVAVPPRAFASTVLPARLRNAPPKEATSLPADVPPVPSGVVPPSEAKAPGEPAAPVPPATIPWTPPVPVVTLLPRADGKKPVPAPAALDAGIPIAPPRSARARKRRLIGTIVFYVLLAFILPGLYFLALHYGSETRVEGQVVPPPGTTLNNEVWIVSDFRELAGGIADDLANERAPKLQEIQERQDHVQRAQADIAAREERVRLLQEQVQAAKDQIASIIKDANDASQKIWDGPGALIEDEYNTRLDQLQAAIAARAKSLGLNYQPDNTYRSPEVWANAYRLALYQTPPGVDNVKEHAWIEDQLKQWRDFTKTLDDRQKALRDEAAKIKLSPAPKVTDVNNQIEDLQHRIDSTISEEDPIKMELQQAETDLVEAQSAEAGLDAKYYQELYALPEQSITKRLPLRPNGRFSWREMERDSAFAEGEQAHNYWIFARAIRPDGRQYWALSRFTITRHSTLLMVIEPDSFISTKAILRPDLPPDEQSQ